MGIENKVVTTKTYKNYEVRLSVFDVVHETTGETIKGESVMITTPSGGRTFWANTEAEAQKLIDDEPVNRSPKNFKFANMHGWSDVHAYEIVRVVSEKQIIVRRMTATKIPFKMDFHPGGFVGHVANQNEQKHTYASNPEAQEIRAYRRKDGYFYSDYGRHALSNEPYEFYDYNF
jgi:hypothetical protein